MRIAVLGCGSIGRRHLRNLYQIGYHDLLAYDPSAEARQTAAQEVPITYVERVEAVWEQRPQIVVVATPSNLHTEFALTAADLGCHLFIEKPLAHTLDSIDRLTSVAQQRRLVTMVGCNMRFHPGPTAVRQLIEQGAVGEIIATRLQFGSYLPRWRPWQDYRHAYSASTVWGGAILDCIHEIDLALWYAGPASLLAAAGRPASTIDLETDGLAEIILRHASGVLTSIHINFVQADYRRTSQIIGSRGTIAWDFAQHRVRLVRERRAAGPDCV